MNQGICQPEQELRERREKELRRFEKGDYITRLIMGGWKTATGYFKLIYIPTGATEDGHTGERKERFQACLTWEFARESGRMYEGYKFNPFPLYEAVDKAFSDALKVWWG